MGSEKHEALTVFEVPEPDPVAVRKVNKEVGAQWLLLLLNSYIIGHVDHLTAKSREKQTACEQ